MARAAAIAPRLLTKEQASTYCGICATTFEAVCPVSPIALGDGARMKRWDIAALDRWIDSLAGAESHSSVDWLDKIGVKSGRRANSRNQ
jgi:hypothetical protein